MAPVRLVRLLVGAVLTTLLIWTFRHSHVPLPSLPIPHLDGTKEVALVQQSALSPDYYLGDSDQPQKCRKSYETQYFNDFAASQVSHCKRGSSSSLSCFYNAVKDDGFDDTFCYGSNAKYDPEMQRFTLGCDQLKYPDIEPNQDLGFLSTYWYQTGPSIIFQDTIDIEPKVKTRPAKNTTILLKREGAFNLWHCMMEIMSASWTLDILEMAVDPVKKTPLYQHASRNNTRVIILDNHEDGPYFDLWGMLGNRPIERMQNVTDDVTYENIVVPLAGASNPMWQGDMLPRVCSHSSLLDTFRKRVLTHYGLDLVANSRKQTSLLYIDRQKGRKLQNSTVLFKRLQKRFPDIKMQSVDMAALSFRDQIKAVGETDVLVGVHGAGLTHTLFLPPASAVVEIFPPELYRNGYRNLAYMRGHRYFSTHAKNYTFPIEEIFDHDWHDEDIELDQEKFMDVLTMAIKSIANKGEFNEDAA